MSDDTFDPFASGAAEPVADSSQEAFDPFASGEAVPDKEEPQTIGGALKQAYAAMGSLEPTMGEKMRAVSMGPLGSLYLMYKNPKRFDVAVEAGIPLVAQALTTEFSPAAQAAVGASTSALGNALAQSRRVIMGEQEEFRPGEMAQSAALGAVPIIGPAKAAVAAARPGLTAAKTALKTSAMMAGAGATGEVLRSEIDEGELPAKESIIVNSAIPGGFSLATAPIAILGSRAYGIGKGMVYRAKELPEGVRPTIGMLRRDLARAEQRIATLSPNSDAARNIQRAYEDFDAMVGTKTVNPQEPTIVMEQLSPLLKQGTTAQEEIAKLSTQAQDAEKIAQQAYDDWMGASLDEYTTKKEIAKQAGEMAFAEQLNSVTENAIQLAQERATGKNPVVLDAVSARNLATEHYAKPLDAAFSEMWDRQYSLFERESREFDVSSLDRQVMDIKLKNRALSSAAKGQLDSLEKIFPSGKASLGELRLARSNIMKRAKSPSILGDEKAVLLDVSAKIKEIIDDQADDVFGKPKGQELRKLNSDYARYRRVMDADGVDSLFSEHPRDEAIEKVVKSMLTGKGTQADEYKNLMAVADYMQEFNPKLGASMRDEFRNIVRGNILMRSADWDSGAQTWMVDPKKFAENLKQLNQADGSLEALNLGNKSIVSDLDKLVQKYPEANKMTADQWTTLFSSPAFRDSLARDGGFGLAVHKAIAQSHAENLMKDSAYAAQMQEAAKAKALRDQAFSTLDEVNGNMEQAQARYEAIMADPDLRILDNPNISNDGLKQFVDSLKNRNVISNAKVSEYMAALDSKNPQAALWVREHYIADFLGDFHEQSPSFFRHKPSRVNTDYMAKLKDLDIPEIKSKWERLKSVVTPEQFSAIDDAVSGAIVMDEYEREYLRPVISGSKQVAAVGQKGKAIDWLSDALTHGRYMLAAKEFSGRAEALRSASQRKALGATAAQSQVVVQPVAKETAIIEQRAQDEEAGPSRDRLDSTRQVFRPPSAQK